MENEEEKILIKIDTEKVCNQLMQMVPFAWDEIRTSDDVFIVRFLYDGENVWYEKNMDYLFRPNEAWKLILILNRELCRNEQLTENIDIDLFIKSKVLQWVAQCLSKTYCKLEFYKLKSFDEDNFKQLAKESKLPVGDTSIN